MGLATRFPTAVLLITALAAGPVPAGDVLRGDAWAYEDPLFGSAEDLAGLEVAGEQVRLSNLAPKKMTDAEAQAALDAVEKVLGGKTATCVITSTDTLGRRVGTCEIDGKDVGDVLAAAGFADPR